MWKPKDAEKDHWLIPLLKRNSRSKNVLPEGYLKGLHDNIQKEHLFRYLSNPPWQQDSEMISHCY